MIASTSAMSFEMRVTFSPTGAPNETLPFPPEAEKVLPRFIENGSTDSGMLDLI
jgi:hypothetical protein